MHAQASHVLAVTFQTRPAAGQLAAVSLLEAWRTRPNFDTLNNVANSATFGQVTTANAAAPNSVGTEIRVLAEKTRRKTAERERPATALPLRLLPAPKPKAKEWIGFLDRLPHAWPENR